MLRASACCRYVLSYGGRRYSHQGLARIAIAAYLCWLASESRIPMWNDDLGLRKTYAKNCYAPYDFYVVRRCDSLVGRADKSLVGATSTDSLWRHIRDVLYRLEYLLVSVQFGSVQSWN